eukprot:GHVU01161823.1.p3 GENE.GHVU01161823.1~~GHVU01161823.1.p3  ORF type:complete len:116 (-),score=18.01 GHVU01161823.1:630-977(-)
MMRSKFVNALDERDVTIGRGLTIGGRRFEVHRIHPPLVYGRRGNPDDSEGIAVAHGSRDGRAIVAVCTYKLPYLSTKMVPQLINFFREHLGDLPAWELPAIAQHMNLDGGEALRP